MDPSRAAQPGRRAVRFPTPGVDAQIAGQIMLAEYSALRTEMDRRATIQWNLLALQVTSAGVIASLAISHASEIALLLVIPRSSCMLGSRYILHDFHLKLINQQVYPRFAIRTAPGPPGLGELKMSQIASGMGPRARLTPTAWNLLHPTRLAFDGLRRLALGHSIVPRAHEPYQNGESAGTGITERRAHLTRQGCIGLDRQTLGRHARDVSAETPCATFHKPFPRKRVSACG